MIAAIFLLGATLFGIGLSERTLGSRINFITHLFFGLVIGWCLTTAAAYGIARVAGQLSPIVSFSVMAGAWFLAVCFWLPRLRSGQVRPSFVKGYRPLLGLLTLLAPLFIVLFRTHMLQQGMDGALYSGGTSTAYDIAFHAALTNSFLYGGNFPPIYPAMPPAPLLYPALPDFQTALLVSLGLDLQTALVWTGVTLALVLSAIFYLFVLSLARGRDGTRLSPARLHGTASLATVLFLLNGGLGFIQFLRDWSKSGVGSLLKTNYGNLPVQGIIWPNLITDILLSQRTTLFGLSLGLIVFTLFALAWRDTERPDAENKWSGWRILLVAGLITGLLPGFHPHSFGAVGIVSVFLFILRPRRGWILFWAPAVLLGAPYLVPILHHMTGEGFVRFRPGWRGPSDGSWFLFWFRNAGLPTLLVIPAWFAAHRSLRLFYLAFAGLLMLSLLIIFSPNDYDNLKLMTYWHAATVILVANWLVHLAARSRMLAIPVVLVVLASIASGGLAVIYEVRSRTLVFDRNEVAAAEFIRAHTPPRSLFLTGPSLHQPVLSLAGRAVVRGPTAWLWSHGYPFAEREADVRAIYSGRDDARELLRYYQVDYIYLGRKETEELRADRAFFDTAFPAIYRAEDIAIYEVQGREKRDVTLPSGYPPREYASRIDRDPSQVLEKFPMIAGELYCLYKVASGVRPRYQEFMADLRQLGRGLYPGSAGWLAHLESNQRDLCREWTERSAFRERYDAMSDAQYVDALNANAGLTLSEQERSSLSAALTAREETRATILRSISARQRLLSHEYNSAYVLCHYFAYLKRNPDEAPDHDFTGYDFWRQQLDRSHDYRGLTRAFLESDEYKRQ